MSRKTAIELLRESGVDLAALTRQVESSTASFDSIARQCWLLIDRLGRVVKEIDKD